LVKPILTAAITFSVFFASNASFARAGVKKVQQKVYVFSAARDRGPECAGMRHANSPYEFIKLQAAKCFR
jgi:hypothetical protein